VHAWHSQERSLTTATSTSTPGEEGSSAPIEIGKEAAVDAAERSEGTGNKVMPTRGGDLR